MNGHGLAILGYEACRAVLEASLPYSRLEPHSWETSDQKDRNTTKIEAYMAKVRPELRLRVADIVQAALKDLPTGEPCDLAARLSAVADCLVAAWLALPASNDGWIADLLRHLTVPVTRPELAMDWDANRHKVEKAGLIFALHKEGLLRPAETLEFIQECCLPLQALPMIVEHTLVALGDHAELLDQVRADSRLIRPAINEALRLTPILVGIKRRLIQPLEINSQKLPTGHVVDVLVGAANRDPAAFPDPDSFHINRNTRPPIIFENENMAYTRLGITQLPGYNHLVIDAAVLALHCLLTDSRTLRTQRNQGMLMFQRLDGRYLQTMKDARIVLE